MYTSLFFSVIDRYKRFACYRHYCLCLNSRSRLTVIILPQRNTPLLCNTLHMVFYRTLFQYHSATGALSNELLFWVTILYESFTVTTVCGALQVALIPSPTHLLSDSLSELLAALSRSLTVGIVDTSPGACQRPPRQSGIEHLQQLETTQLCSQMRLCIRLWGVRGYYLGDQINIRGLIIIILSGLYYWFLILILTLDRVASTTPMTSPT